MTTKGSQNDTELWDDILADQSSHDEDSDTSPEDDSLDIDLDDIFQNLGPPESRKQQLARRSQTLSDTGAIAARALGQWQKTRRVLYIQRRRCQHCHTIHTLPNDRVLTEYRHARGQKQWATSGPGDLSLPHSVEYLDGKPVECCQNCFDTPTEDPEVQS